MLNVREMVINDLRKCTCWQKKASSILETKQNHFIENFILIRSETFKNGLIEEENVEQLRNYISGSINSNLSATTCEKVLDIAYKMLKMSVGNRHQRFDH